MPGEDMKLRFETFCSGGKGGQHVNKVETGVRIIHVPTGISVVSTEARTQHMNKKLAMNRLCDILADMEPGEQTEGKGTGMAGTHPPGTRESSEDLRRHAIHQEKDQLHCVICHKILIEYILSIFSFLT